MRRWADGSEFRSGLLHFPYARERERKTSSPGEIWQGLRSATCKSTWSYQCFQISPRQSVPAMHTVYEDLSVIYTIINRESLLPRNKSLHINLPP